MLLDTVSTFSIAWSSCSEQVNCDQAEQPGWETADESEWKEGVWSQERMGMWGFGAQVPSL